MRDLGEVGEGDWLDGVLAVHSVQAPTPYDGGQLVRLELGNATGTLPAKLWLGPDEEHAHAVADDLSPGTVVQVNAPVRSYRGRPEISLEAPPERAEEFDPAELLPTTDAHVGRMMHRCLTAARSIDDEPLRRLVLHVWREETTRQLIARAPATKRRHRDHLGGWIEHVHAELALAETLAQLHDPLDRDLLVAGVLLHDLGRLDAYEAEATIDLTSQGRLLGTALLADERLEEAIEACGLDEQRALHVRHMAASHAGSTEWGAPVEPATPEAIALHAIERLDTQLARALAVVEQQRERGREELYSSKLGRFLHLAKPTDPPDGERGREADGAGEEPRHGVADVARTSAPQARS